MTETVTLTREELETLIDQRVAAQSRRGTASGNYASSDDPIMAEAAGQVRRSFPDSPKEQMAQLAKIRGGLYSADNPEWRKYKACRHARPRQCDLCWTPETEARWEFALGLTEKQPVPLDDREEPGAQYGDTPVRRMERGPGGRPRRAPDTREPAHS